MSQSADIKDRYVSALLELRESKPLNKVSVTDLLKQARTARQTFYNHFRDINDLIVYVTMQSLERNQDAFRSPDGSAGAFQYVIEHKGFYTQLPYHSGQNCFRDSHLAWLRKSYYEVALDDTLDKDEYQRRKLLVDAFLYAAVDLFLEWCKSGMDRPPEAIAAAIFDIKPRFIDDEPPGNFEIESLD